MRTAKQKANGLYQSASTIQTPKLPPTEEQIRLRAHEIYVARGGTPGTALNDWLQAEGELTRKLAGLATRSQAP